MTDATRKTLELIKKLMAKAESAASIGSAEEAAAFAAKANELLMDHDLSLSDLEFAALDQTEPVDREAWDAENAGLKHGKRLAWLESLARSVTTAHFCTYLVIPGTRHLIIVGRKTDRMVAGWLLTVLVAAAERLGHAHYYEARNDAIKRGMRPPERAKDAFLLGFVVAIRRRLVAMRTQVEHTGGQHAIVRFNAAQLAVEKWEEKNVKRHVSNVKKGAQTNNKASFDAGIKAGNQVNLNSAVGGDTGAKTTLAAGQTLLGRGR